MTIHLSCAIALPADHPARDEGGIADSVLAQLGGILVHNATYYPWEGQVLPAASYTDAFSALQEMSVVAEQGDPRDRYVSFLITDGGDGNQWLPTLLKMWPFNAGLVIVLTNEASYDFFYAVSVAAERNRIMTTTCNALLTDQEAREAALNHLAVAAAF